MTKKPAKTSPSPEEERQFVRSVVLDWNILHYWVSDKMRDKIMPVLLEVDKADLQFVVSEISIYEAQCRMPVGKHIEAVQFVETLPLRPVDTDTHKIAGVVKCCYKDHEKTKGHAKDISLQDVLNASCALQYNALLLTADYEDYPPPFFDQLYHWTITNDSGHSQKIYLVAPDVDQFDLHTTRWVKAAEDYEKQRLAMASGKSQPKAV
jgi:predicted nucleic acid-binding protein